MGAGPAAGGAKATAAGAKQPAAGGVKRAAGGGAKAPAGWSLFAPAGGFAKGAGGGGLAEIVKFGQRHSPAWKEAWSTYVRENGASKNDPTLHSDAFIAGFLEFAGNCGSMCGMGMGGLGMMGGMGMMAQGGRPAKRQRTDGASTGDSAKDKLVNRIKAYQRSGDAEKQQWWSYFDEELDGVRDPAKHEIKVLEH